MGALIGALIGCTAVGGGVLLVPLIAGPLRRPMAIAVGTSSVVALGLLALTALMFAGAGQADWAVAGLLIAGGLGGVAVGTRLCTVVRESSLRVAVLAALVVALAGLGWRVVG